tara:strand:- start:1333 stop:2253 length:921 start_codon:yes stop_codon:yes gene_type:complete
MNTIVITTINKPTEALKKFVDSPWADSVLIVGDLKTPHETYVEFANKNKKVTYLDPDFQNNNYKDISDAIGWNSISRRSIGFIHAYKEGKGIIATVDDDNIPYSNWGENCSVGKEVNVKTYTSDDKVFDPLSVTNYNYLWHRGFPLELVKNKNNVKEIGYKKKKVLIQADLWNGDPDIDAIQRITLRPECKFNISELFCSNKISPFDSQNTFVHREIIPFYMMIPHVGRMDDIWGSYIAQKHFPNSLVYGPASVYQERNPQNLIKNLKDEIIGYEFNMSILDDVDKIFDFLPKKSYEAYKIYQDYF